MTDRVSADAIAWTRDEVAGMALRRFSGQVGAVTAGAVEFDAANGMWIWSSPLAEEAWGWATDEAGAKRALEVWLRGWLENFRPLLDRAEARMAAPLKPG